MSDSPTAGTVVVRRLFATLRRHRYVVYVGGVALVVLVSLLAPSRGRRAVTVAALALMCTTYLAELHGRAEAVRAEAVVAGGAVAGVAGGAYLLVAVNRLGGLLFVVGGILFFRAAVRTQR